ncbi:hypothetical protein CJO70_19165 [Burkholderia ubonensis]|nr:hypothetical protein CJO70_19165 [Burkholderia ubonensis]PAJ93075.1 hypothetical protein CJO69_18540 [Burkholderia ubonensis]
MPTHNFIKRSTDSSHFYFFISHFDAIKKTITAPKPHRPDVQIDRVDRAILRQLQRDELLYLPGVRQIRTFIVLREILTTAELPV